MKKKKTKRKLIIILSVILIVVLAGASVFQFYIRPKMVNYAFNKVTDAVISSMGEPEDGNAEATEPQPEEPPAEETEPPQDGQTSNQEETAAEAAKKKRKEEVNSMSVNQVAAVVAASPSLTAKLESIVSQGDKERVIGILLSNFSKEELAKYSAEAASGMSSARKRELMSVARGRLTSAQWSQCMQLFSKYVDQLRGVIAEKPAN